MGAPRWDAWEGSPFTGISEISLKGSRNGVSLWALCKGNLKGGFFTGDPEGYVEKALETDMSLHRGPAGKP